MPLFLLSEHLLSHNKMEQEIALGHRSISVLCMEMDCIATPSQQATQTITINSR